MDEEIAIYLSFLILLGCMVGLIILFSLKNPALKDIINILFIIQIFLLIVICLMKIFEKVIAYHFLVIMYIQLGMLIALLLLAAGKLNNLNIKLLTIIVNNVVGILLSDYSLIEALIQFSMFIFAFFVYAGKPDDIYNEKFVFAVMYQSYIALFLVYIGFSRNMLIISLFLLFNIIVKEIYDTKEKFESGEKIVDVRKSYYNTYSTWVMYYNIQVRRLFNLANKNICNAVIFTSIVIIVGIIIILMGFFGSAYLFAMSIAVFDYNSKAAVLNWNNNQLYRKRATNNLSDIQYRSMRRAAEAAVEVVTTHGKEIASVGGAIGTGIIIKMGYDANQTAKEQTDQLKRAQDDENVKWAVEQSTQAVTPKFAEDVLLVAQTGDMVHIKNSVGPEIKARNVTNKQESETSVSSGADMASSGDPSNCTIS